MHAEHDVPLRSVDIHLNDCGLEVLSTAQIVEGDGSGAARAGVMAHGDPIDIGPFDLIGKTASKTFS